MWTTMEKSFVKWAPDLDSTFVLLHYVQYPFMLVSSFIESQQCLLLNLTGCQLIIQ